MYELTDPEFVSIVERGIPLKTLESRLEPYDKSKELLLEDWTDHLPLGYVGKDENVLQVIHSDWKLIERHGLTHEQISAALKTFLLDATKPKISFKDALRDTFKQFFFIKSKFLNKNYEFIEFNSHYLIYRSCPWGCDILGRDIGYIAEKGLSEKEKRNLNFYDYLTTELECNFIKSTDYEIKMFLARGIKKVNNEKNMKSALITTLLPHFIKEHYFFNGKQTPNRAEPELLIKALKL